MKKHATLTALILAAGLAATSAVTFADPSFGHGDRHCNGDSGRHGSMGHGMMPGGMGDHMPPFLRGLNLTQQQRDKIFDINYAQMPTLRKTGEQMWDLKRQQMAMTLSDKYDPAKVKQLIEQQTQLQAKMQIAMADSRHQIYQVLTADQRKQLVERQQRRPWGKDRR